jgi:hypothetical protein
MVINPFLIYLTIAVCSRFFPVLVCFVAVAAVLLAQVQAAVLA